MPNGSYPFPMYSGLFEPKHYKNITSAIWLFAWCISSTTKEVEEDGTVWGIVLGNKPMKLSEIGEQFGVNDKTVSRWLDALQEHDYIQVKRAPRGLIIKVKNSKKDLLKRSDKNVRSQSDDKTNMSDHPNSEQTFMSDHGNGDKTYLSEQNASEQTKVSDHEPILPSDQTKMSDAKDIITITTTNLDKEWWEEDLNQNPPADGMLAILDAYCKMHSKFDIHVSAAERQAMGQMVAGGIPVPFTIQTMATMYKAKQGREGEDFEQAKSFAYYIDGIEQAWKNTKAGGKPEGKRKAKITQSEPPRKTKQQQEIEDLQRRAREAEELEKSTSH
ncbi:phage-like element PBSX protein XkdB [Paenibacillus albidus]|uniref:Phage-like element PBSX protein XkdB n=1 Tax=Paenibacillus albidus TaxID=2041023 RepID=A0A917FGK6_9BACL|nr:hypothetical protein [Paenibacillus albidus]GGF77440.1 phage-like element PBSX protein XkdB [Paenibacillus albidus]